MRWVGHVASMGEMINAYNIFIGNSDAEDIDRHTQEHNIKMYLRELGWEGVNWIHLAQDRD
jgi:hypothetical protein